MNHYRIGLKLWSTNTDCYFDEAKRLYEGGVFQYIELYVVPNTESTISKWASMGIPFIIHCCHSAHDFNLAKPENEQYNKDIYAQTKRFADTLDAQYIIFHGGLDGTVQETARQLRLFNEPRTLVENKPFLALPNSKHGRLCRGASLAELEYILSEVQCGFCLDIGHAVCAANSQGIDPYGYLNDLNFLKPAMYHLSDITNMTSPYDEHPHLGSGKLDIARLVHNLFHQESIISIETSKESKRDLEDFKKDCIWIRNCK